MKAAYYNSFGGPITIEQLPDPTPSSDGVVLKVNATGLCLSDWHGWKGHDKDISLPHVPGHELSGEIVAIGKHVKGWRKGQRVTLPFVCGCGSCSTCQDGNPQVCPDQFQPGFTQWGSFAEYVAIKYAETNLVALPDSISDETAASLGCRFATSFRAVVDQGNVQPGDTVAIFGCGGVGLSAIMISKALGARIIAIDRKKGALNKANEIGADHTIHSHDDINVAEEVKDLTGGGAHLTIDAIGNVHVLQSAIMSLRRRGKHIQIGQLSSELVDTIIPIERVIAYELTILGSHGMQATRYLDMITMIEKKVLNPDLLVNRTISLEEGILALPELISNNESGMSIINTF